MINGKQMDMTENRFAFRRYRRRHWAQLLVVTLLAAFCGWTVAAQTATVQADAQMDEGKPGVAEEKGLEVPEGARVLIV